MYIAIGNSEGTISYMGCNKNFNKLKEDLNNRYGEYGEFMDFPCDEDNNLTYLNNDGFNVCIINTDEIKSELIWRHVE